MTQHELIRPRQPLRVLSGTLLALTLLTTGCKQQEAKGQTIATVNGEAITTSDLQAELATAPAAQRKQVQPTAVRSLVNRQLLVEYAKKEGLDRRPDYILQVRRMGDVLLAERAAQQIMSSSRQPITTAAVNDYITTHPDIAANRRVMVVNELQFATPSQAVLNELKPTKTMDELIAVLRRRGVAAQGGRSQLDTAALPDATSAKLSGLAPGEPLISVNGAQTVALAIVESRPAPLSGDVLEQVARRRMEAVRASAALNQRGEALRRQAKITYAEGYRPPEPAAAKK